MLLLAKNTYYIPALQAVKCILILKYIPLNTSNILKQFDCVVLRFLCITDYPIPLSNEQWHTKVCVGGFVGFKPPWHSEVLTKLSRISSSVENTSVTT
jgi:hypothetical protein